MRELAASRPWTPRPAWVLLVLAGLVVAGLCSSCRGSGSTGLRSGACATGDDAEPALEQPPEVGRVTSRVSMVASITIARLKAELRRVVPTSLARGEEDAGAPGRVTYAVERGPLELSLAGDRLVVSTNVTAQVSVCKPIGGFCVGYGRCSPTLVSSASVPLLLEPSYEIGESRVSFNLTRGCRIAGFDVSHEVSREAAQAVAETKREIDRQRPKLSPWVAEGWSLLAQPVALDANSCLRLAPEQIAQRRPRLEEGVLSTAAVVTGTVELEQPCRERADALPEKPPPLEVVDRADPESVLEVPSRIGWSDIGATVTRALGAPAEGAPGVRSTRARGALIDGKPRVVLGLGVEGACEDSWFSAEPWYDAAARRVRLRAVERIEGARGGVSRKAALALAQRVEREVEVPLPYDPARAEAALRALLRGNLDEPPGVDVTIDLAPAEGRVLVEPGALVAVVGLRGTLAIRVAEAS